MSTHSKVLGVILNPNLTYSTHIHNLSLHAHNLLQPIKAVTATWGKQKETLMATYKAAMRPDLVYAFSIWSPISSSTSINKLQVMQNASSWSAIGCTQDRNIQHLHEQTLILPIHGCMQLHASQLRQKHNIHHTPYTNTNTKHFPTPRHIHHHYSRFLTSPTQNTSSLQLTHIRTTMSPLDLWTDPAGDTELLARWTEKLAGRPQAGRSDSSHLQG